MSPEEIKERFDGVVEEERMHARQLGQRMDELDGRPSAWLEFETRQNELQPPEDPADVVSVIQGVIAAEDDAIDTYRSLISAARDADDLVTEDLAIELLTDEEGHRSKFKGFLIEYR